MYHHLAKLFRMVFVHRDSNLNQSHCARCDERRSLNRGVIRILRGTRIFHALAGLCKTYLRESSPSDGCASLCVSPHFGVRSSCKIFCMHWRNSSSTGCPSLMFGSLSWTMTQRKARNQSVRSRAFLGPFVMFASLSAE